MEGAPTSARITGGPTCQSDGEFERKLRIPITAPPHDLTRAVAILAEARRDLPDEPAPPPRHVL